MDGTDSDSNKNDFIGDNDDFKIKGAATRARNHGKQKEVAEECIICLQPITERAVAVPCNHLAFDFICLVSWLQQRDTCPLCNTILTEVQYDWFSPDDYKTYRLHEPQPEQARQSGGQRSRRRIGENLTPYRFRNVPQNAGHRSHDRPNSTPLHPEDGALSQRRRVYQEKLYSLHVGANSVSRYRDFTPQDYVSSTTLQSRARMFLRRELQLFSYFDSGGRARNREFVLEYIVAVLKKFDPKGADGRAEDFLSEFFERENARLLLHELQAWLRSPYATLDAWDRNVQYAEDGAQLRRSKATSGE